LGPNENSHELGIKYNLASLLWNCDSSIPPTGFGRDSFSRVTHEIEVESIFFRSHYDTQQ
jgi:hypothetical protein